LACLKYADFTDLYYEMNGRLGWGHGYGHTWVISASDRLLEAVAEVAWESCEAPAEPDVGSAISSCKLQQSDDKLYMVQSVLRTER
jgi:hypothetical protein